MDPEPPAPPSSPQPLPPPPPPPGPDASRGEWHDWRHAQRDYERAQWRQGRSYGSSWFGRGWFWGGLLVLAGVYFLLSNLGLLWWLHGDVFWPSVLILIGVLLIARRGQWWR